jgi:hypothetical protein
MSESTEGSDGTQTSPADPAASPASENDASAAPNVEMLNDALADAELMLAYAIESGVAVDPGVVGSVLESSEVARHGWTKESGTRLLIAGAAVASMLKPVSAESLRNTEGYRRKSLRRRLLLPLTMGLLAAIIVLYSTLAFLFSSFSTSISKNLDVATPLAVKLVNELGAAPSSNGTLCLNSVSPAPSAAAPSIDTPAVPAADNRKEVIDDLQQFAAAIRDMYGDARRMNRLYQTLLFSMQDPESLFDPRNPPTSAKLTEMLELPPGLPNLAQAATERVCVYQRVRYYAQSTEKSATILTGAVASSILPVLYALLGAGAYVLRRLECQLRSHTFISEAHSPRFITAAIAGTVVGLFNFGQGVSVSPLAIAFLSGYAVDVFFKFLETLIQALSKSQEERGANKEPV